MGESEPWTVNILPVLKLANIHMKKSDRGELCLFGPVVLLDGELFFKTSKTLGGHFAEPVFVKERKDLWEPIDSIETLIIVAKGMAAAIDLLVHLYIMTGEQLRQISTHVVDLSAKLDARVAVCELLEALAARI